MQAYLQVDAGATDQHRNTEEDPAPLSKRCCGMMCSKQLKYESVRPQDDEGASKLRLHHWAGIEDRGEHIGVAEHAPNL